MADFGPDKVFFVLYWFYFLNISHDFQQKVGNQSGAK